MSSQLDTTDYTSTERIDGDVWCKFSVETMREMQKELDNRNPQTFGLKTTPDFFKLAEIEVIENQLRVVMKHYKNANKKKSPFSAWKSVFAHLEALTLFLQSKDSWATTEYATPESKKRALDVYNAYGAAWISTAEKLVGMASFSEGFLPSVRSAVKAALALGTSLAERFPKTNRWPDKLESLWTGTPMIGEKPKRSNADDEAAGDSKKKDKKKKAKGEDDEEADDKKKKKGSASKKASSSAMDAPPVDPWDFESAVDMLKAGRKQIGGSIFDIAIVPEADRERIAAAAVTAPSA